MRNINIGQTRRANRGPCIYRDTSSRGKKRLKDGTVKTLKPHDCWRAELDLCDAGGVKRVRRRFKTYEEARAWLWNYKP